MEIKKTGLNLKIANPIIFLRQVKTELAKVDWPSRQQTIKLTAIVVGASFLVGAYLGTLDWLFTLFLTYLVR